MTAPIFFTLEMTKKKLLFNKLSREQALEKLRSETFQRLTLSFYRYTQIEDPASERNNLFEAFENMSVLGRIYIAQEGINGQINLPEPNLEEFKTFINGHPFLKGIRLNMAIEQKESFFKLIIKTKKQIVADNLPADAYDLKTVGNHLSAEDFNNAIEKDNPIVIDMRNHYESEVGHFQGAICPDADTFREELEMVTDLLKDKKDQKVLMYCTGGIRCEKASAYFLKQGFQDVNQLEGGIIKYTNDIKEKGIPSKFIGKNFVFDERLGERVTEDIIAKCHICDTPSDDHKNCANDHCHILFIQCKKCEAELNSCCSQRCNEILNLPEEVKANMTQEALNNKGFSKRLRPKLNNIGIKK